MDITKEQSYKIQILRGIAIIAVVFIHHTPFGMTSVFIRPFLNYTVALFLFLSGLLSNRKRWNPMKRVYKVLIPYVFWTLIYTLIYCENFFSLRIILSFIKGLITGRSEVIMYYIFVYCQLTFLIPLVDKMAHSKYKLFPLLISPLEVLSMRLIPLLLGFHFNEIIKMIISVSCLGWFSYFYFGYLLGNEFVKIKIKERFLWICLLISIIFSNGRRIFLFDFGKRGLWISIKNQFINYGSDFFDDLLQVLGKREFY